MSDDYEEYEKECKIIKEENKELLDKFYDWLKAKKLKKTTCNNHCRNIDFYINDFLVYEAPTRPHEGVHEIGMFLGYWFIRKAMWASQSTIKQNAASLKKFYQFMFENGKIDQENLDSIKLTIKEDMPEWLATVQRYDDPSIEDSSEIWEI